MKFPKYEKIPIDRVNAMTIILEAGSNKLTKWAMRKLHKWKYEDICFTHAFIHIQHNDCINVGFSNYIEPLSNIVKKSHRYIAIYLDDLSSNMKKNGIRICYKKAGSKKKKFKFYDFKGFIWQGIRKFPVLRKSKLAKKIFKPSDSSDFCSDLVADVFKEIEHPAFEGVNDEETTPNDIYTLLKDYKPAAIQEISVE